MRANPRKLQAFLLCEKLGFAHPRYLLPLLWPDDLTEWNAFYAIVYGRPGEDEDEVRPAEDIVAHFRSLDGHRVAGDG